MADDIWTIPRLLRYRADNSPDTKAFTFYDKDGLQSYLSFRDFYTLSGKFARCLHEWGFQPGDIIASGLPNSPERVITDFGIMMAGCAAANCQVTEKDGLDFWNAANMSQCCAVILCPKEYDPVYQLFCEHISDANTDSEIQNLDVPQAPAMKRVILCDRRKDNAQNSFLERLRRSEREILEFPCEPSRLALLFPTSGSSGFCKLVPETHERLVYSGRMFKASQSSVYYIDRPMGWTGGFPYDILCHGTRRIVQDRLLDNHTDVPNDIWNIITEARCTGAAILPKTLCELVELFKNRPPDHKVMFITTSGQAMKEEMMGALGLLTCAVVVSYGSTEGGMFALDAVTSPSQFKDFYAGKIMADVEVKVVDEKGNALGYGQEGEFYIRSKRLLKEYYNKSSQISVPTEIYTDDGWFKSGDRGYVEDNNCLYCIGRKGDLVKFGTFIIYLSWPESILNKCPRIQTVSAVGVDGDVDTAQLIACVVPKADHKDLTEADVMGFFRESCMNQIGRKFSLGKMLTRVVIMDSLPLLPSGKINKRKLKQMVV